MGATLHAKDPALIFDVSIHAPVMGATKAQAAADANKAFLSTPP